MFRAHLANLSIVVLALMLAPKLLAEDDGGAQQRTQAAQKMKEGNYKDAFRIVQRAGRESEGRSGQGR